MSFPGPLKIRSCDHVPYFNFFLGNLVWVTCSTKMAASAARNYWTVHFTQLSSPLFRRKSGFFRFKISSPVKRTHSYVTLGSNGKKNGEILRKGSFVFGVVLGSYVGLWFYNERRKRPFIKTTTLRAKDMPNLDSILETPSRVGTKSKQFNFVADVVEIIAPAVVHIEGHGGKGDGFLGHIMVPSFSGSGFLVTEDGLVLTNAHVVKNMRNVKVTLADGSKLVGDIVSLDQALDLAAVQLRNKTKVTIRQHEVAFIVYSG